MAAERDDDTISARPGDPRGGEGNVVYLAGAARAGSAGGEGVAGGAGDDTIGVSGTVLAFGRSSGMRFLDGADSGLAVGGAGAAVPGGLGSATLFGGSGDAALLAAPIAAAAPSGPLDEFALAAAALPDVIGPLGPGAGAAVSPRLPGQPSPGSAAAGILHLPDGTTVTMLDLSKLGGSSLL